MSHWPRDSVVCARVVPRGSLSQQSKSLQAALRKTVGVPKGYTIDLTREECVFEWNSHRVLWHNEWELDEYAEVYMYFVDAWNRKRLTDRLRKFQELTEWNRYLQVQWQPAGTPYSNIRTLLSIGHGGTDVVDTENRSLWTHHAWFDNDVSGADGTLEREIFDLWCPDAKRVETPETSALKSQFAESPSTSLAESLTPELKLSGPNQFHPGYSVYFSNQPSQERAVEQFLAALELCERSLGPPDWIQFHMICGRDAMRHYAEGCRHVDKVCSYWEFLGKYHRGFSPFKCPSLPANEVVAYPVIRFGNDTNHPLTKLYLGANIIWKGEDGFLELQTTEGPDHLQRIADAAGLEIEIWHGPLADRWGLYTD